MKRAGKPALFQNLSVWFKKTSASSDIVISDGGANLQRNGTKAQWEKVNTVQKMQNYINQYAGDSRFSYEELYRLAGYSERHAVRIFKELTGKTPREYVRVLRLSSSAQALVGTEKNILETALDSCFDSHEGYTKAFSQTFGISPAQYKKGKTPIPLFIPYPIETYYKHLWKKGENEMEPQKPFLCMITPVERPGRKLMIRRSKKAHDYWSYCDEMGCYWEGLFNSIPEKMDTAAILTLPDCLNREGYGNIASGVELPCDYTSAVPEGCELLELSPCTMLYFQGPPFQTDEEFFRDLGRVFQAVDTYDPSLYGYEWAYDLAPRFNFGGQWGKGAKLAVPVRKIQVSAGR